MFVQALYLYNIALELSPNDTIVMGNIGGLLSVSGKDDASMAMLERAVAIDSKAINCMLNLAGQLKVRAFNLS